MPLNITVDNPASVPAKVTAIHISTSRLTQTINLHTFHVSPASGLHWTPSQHIELQLPPELDLISGGAALDDEARRLPLTPCRYKHISQGDNINGKNDANVNATTVSAAPHDTVEVQFVTRNGSLTSQIGLPRFRALEACVIGCGGGFLSSTFRSVEVGTLASEKAARVAVAVAGGVGICAFLAIAGMVDIDAASCRVEHTEHNQDKASVHSPVLFWTLHVDDWEFVRFAVKSGLLLVDVWSRVHVFLTTGTEKIAPGLEEVMAEGISKTFNADKRLSCHFRRMQMEDLGRAIEHSTAVSSCHSGLSQRNSSTVYFCGGKALEWQVKRWARTMNPSVAVHTTKVQK